MTETTTAVSAEQPAAEEAPTAKFLASFANTTDPRLKQLMQSLTRHLHTFIREVRLTEEEWEKAIEFLTQVGHITDDRRQEFLLLSDVLGASMQTIGSWLRHPAGAILLPVPLFVLGHEYGWVGQLDIAAAWLTWRPGGLEAAIGLHIIGNCLAFGFGAIGLSDLNATDIPPLSVAFSIGLTLSYTVLVTRAHTWWRTLPPTTATAEADPRD